MESKKEVQCGSCHHIFWISSLQAKPRCPKCDRLVLGQKDLDTKSVLHSEAKGEEELYLGIQPRVAKPLYWVAINSILSTAFILYWHYAAYSGLLGISFNEASVSLVAYLLLALFINTKFGFNFPWASKSSASQVSLSVLFVSLLLCLGHYIVYSIMDAVTLNIKKSSL